MQPRVFLVDDHELIRKGIRAELAGSVDVVGEADEVEAAVEIILERRPDVVLLDVHMPDGGGVAVLRRVLDVAPEVRFLALSVSDAADDVIRVIRAGARGYVTKNISGPDLLDAIYRVAAGDAVFSPRLAGFVLDAFSLEGRTLEAGRRRPRPRPAHPAGAPGPASDRAGLLLPRHRRRVIHLYQDRREPRLVRAAQAPTVESAPALQLGEPAPPQLASAAR